MRSAIVARPLDPAALLAEVGDPSNGASILFVGTVRNVNDGRDVTGIDYAAYLPMAERELAAIVAEAAERFHTNAIAVEHRLGHLSLLDASVAIAVAHPHRAAAYDASRFIIEELKRRVPIWKREEYVDGTREWVGSDGERRQTAESGEQRAEGRKQGTGDRKRGTGSCLVASSFPRKRESRLARPNMDPRSRGDDGRRCAVPVSRSLFPFPCRSLLSAFCPLLSLPSCIPPRLRSLLYGCRVQANTNK